VSVDVRPVVSVARTRADIAAYLFDPAHDLEWTGGITASRRDRPDRTGPLREGESVTRTARFLGRTFDYGYVVTRHQRDRLLEMRVDRPFPMLVRYELRDAGGTPEQPMTEVAIHATGSPGRFFAWATPVLRAQVRRSIAADLGRLRRTLEA
jgi:hypothetical protein